MMEIQPNYLTDLISPVDASEYCTKHITQHYPLGKQMTVERRGSETEKQKMHIFIDACIDWSNGSTDLRLKDLYKIQP